MIKYTPEFITELKQHEVFVFGSNLAGRHGAGAAKQAVKFGAEYGRGFGHYGKTFAIPTKDTQLNVLIIPEIAKYILQFRQYSEINQQFDFLVTKIGCGHAGYDISDIAPLFNWWDANLNPNIFLPKEFVEYNDSKRT